MKYVKPINEFWGDVLKRDLLGETREEDKFHSKKEIKEYLRSEIQKQGKNVVIQNLDVSLVEDLSELFSGICNGVKTLDLSGWKTSNAKDMNWLFWSCSTIESLDLSGWDTSNVENMSYMFSHCRNFKSLDLSGWDTSKVYKMIHAFYDCNSLKSLDLSGWDTSSVMDETDMFAGCPAPYEIVDCEIVRKDN